MPSDGKGGWILDETIGWPDYNKFAKEEMEKEQMEKDKLEKDKLAKDAERRKPASDSESVESTAKMIPIRVTGPKIKTP